MVNSVNGIPISIIIPAYNVSEQTLFSCVKSVLQQVYVAPYEVIIVDDGSEKPISPSLFLNIQIPQNADIFLVHKKNGGPGSARNEGLYRSKGELVAFIDSDCIAKEDWIAKIIIFFDGNQALSGLGGCIKPQPPKTFTQKFCAFTKALSPIFDEYGHLITAITANACFKARDLQAVGGFHSAYQWAFSRNLRAKGFEDGEISQRLRDENYCVAYAPEVIVYHQHRQTVYERLKQWHGYGVGASVYMALRQYRGVSINLQPYIPPHPLTFRNIFASLWEKRVFHHEVEKFANAGLSLKDSVLFAYVSVLQRIAFWSGLKKGQNQIRCAQDFNYNNLPYQLSGQVTVLRKTHAHFS